MFKNTFADERTQRITLKAGMFAFTVMISISYFTMGKVKNDEQI